MTTISNKRAMPIFCRSMLCAIPLGLAGCAGPGWLQAGADAPAFRSPAVSMQNAGDTIIIGKTSKAEVIAALGAATVVNFDSGYEVWVYRSGSRAPAETKAEFVILFTPDGVVKKTRLRPAYAARS